jgi:hypothetical protein
LGRRVHVIASPSTTHAPPNSRSTGIGSTRATFFNQINVAYRARRLASQYAAPRASAARPYRRANPRTLLGVSPSNASTRATTARARTAPPFSLKYTTSPAATLPYGAHLFTDKRTSTTLRPARIESTYRGSTTAR